MIRYHLSKAVAERGHFSFASQILFSLITRMQLPYRILLWRLNPNSDYRNLL